MTIAFLVLITCPNDSILLLYFFFRKEMVGRTLMKMEMKTSLFDMQMLSRHSPNLLYVLKVEVGILKMQSTC